MSSPKSHWEGLFDFDNPLFAGGTSIAILAGTAALGRRSLIQGAGLVKRRLLVNLEISKKDESYQWVLYWLALPRPPPPRIIASMTKLRNLEMKTIPQSAENPMTQFKVMPGFGSYLIRHNNAYIHINREKQGTASMHGGEPHETLTLTTLSAHEHVFEEVFTEAYQLAVSQREGKTHVYTSKGVGWEKLGDGLLKRPPGSVILDEGVKEQIMKDVDDFLASKDEYTECGTPYRRGYLLHGPPGSGKTSFIQALAGELDYSIAVINVGERGMTDDRLVHLLTKLPPRSILVLEDVDAAFGNNTKVGADGYSGSTVTMSGLLNSLDGLVAAEGRITFLTTNFPGELEPRLIRDGRVDMKVYIGNATKHQAGMMWDKFYGAMDAGGIGKEHFLKHVESLGYFGGGKETSMAAIQGLFLANKRRMDGAIRMAEERLHIA